MSQSAVIEVDFTLYGDDPLVTLAVRETISSAAYVNQPITLTNGNTSLSVPTGATQLILRNGTVACVLKGVNGDTGVTIPVGGTLKLPLNSGGTYVLGASSSGTIQAIWA